MKQVYRIDNNGMYLEPVILEEGQGIEHDCIDIVIPEGFYRPKWSNGQWVEGLTQEEIDAILNPVVPIDPKDERISQLEIELAYQKEQQAQTSADLQAFMDYYFTNGGI